MTGDLSTALPYSAPASEDVIDILELQQVAHQAIRSLGFSVTDSATMIKVLMYAQIRGNSQSLVKVVSGGLPRDPACEPPIIEQEGRLSARVDGRKSFGMIAMQLAVNTALAKVAENGIAVVGTHGTASGTGALGFWADCIARSGYVALVFSQSPEYVAPHGSSQAIFGTNPIAFGVPRKGEEPLVMDMATSSTAFFALVEAQRAGRPVAQDIGFDANGAVTTDPAAILNGGAMRTFDRGYKGSHLALMVELLAGSLVGATVTDKLHGDNWGNLVVALDPSLLGDAATFRERVEAVLRRVEDAKPLPGCGPVRLPGVSGSQLAAERTAAGQLPIDSNLLAELRALAASAPPPESQQQQAASNDSMKETSAAEAAPSSRQQSHSAAQQPLAGRERQPGAARGAGLSRTPVVVMTAGVQQEAPPQQWQQQRGMSTTALHPSNEPVQDPYQALSPPIYQTATFGQPNATENGPYDYTRSGNPTRALFEARVAELEGADRALAFTSGMAALNAVVRLAAAGQHIVAGDDLYGGTSRLLQRVAPALGISVSNVDMSDVRNVEEAMIPGKTAVVMIESPTNPRMRICDIAAIASIAHRDGAICCVDNSMMAPVFQRPLDLGADISMTSITKFIGGHSDITGGTLSIRGTALANRIYFTQNAEGAGLSPFDSWLSARGLKTMALRMERQAASCAILAAYLDAHPLVCQVNYAGLSTHPGADVHMRQASSPGSLLSFTTNNVEASRIVVENTELFTIAVSFGSVSSTISMPCFMSHASIPSEVRAARGLPDDLVRISVGVEDVDDLLIDLHQALQQAMTKVGMPLDSGPMTPFDHKPAGGQEVAALRNQIHILQAELASLKANKCT